MSRDPCCQCDHRPIEAAEDGSHFSQCALSAAFARQWPFFPSSCTLLLASLTSRGALGAAPAFPLTGAESGATLELVTGYDTGIVTGNAR
jgi:hypothetical protein